VGALDDPAACAKAGLAFERLRFLAAATDVGGEAELDGELAYLVAVVAAVEAETLRLLGCRLGPLDRDRLERRACQLEVVAVRARRGDPDRDALALGEEAPFRPFLALSVGFGPVSSPPNGAFPSAPSIASHSHSMPTCSSYASKPCRQNSRNTPASAHSRKRRFADEQEQIPVASSAFHCIPVRNTNRIAFIASRSGTRGR
jgi:hypothetical protein